MTVEALIHLFESSSLLSIISMIFLINLALTLGEVILNLLTHKERRWKDTAANCAIFVVGQVLEGTVVASIGLIGLLPFYWLVPWEIPMLWWTWLLAFIAADFTYYWLHRIEHVRRILWASHSVHHSSEVYNLTVGFRLSWVDPYLAAQPRPDFPLSHTGGMSSKPLLLSRYDPKTDQARGLHLASPRHRGDRETP